jgi:hypothetical protein
LVFFFVTPRGVLRRPRGVFFKVFF